MIPLRQHVVSLAAVLVALAVGVVLGAGGVSERLLGALTAQVRDLDGEVAALTAERDGLVAAQRSAEEFSGRVGPVAVRGALPGRRVALVTAGADAADRDAVLALLGTSGAVVTGEVGLTPAVGDPARADQLRELSARLLPTGAQLPVAADTGSLVGGLLGAVLLARDGRPQATDAQAEGALGGLVAAGFVVPGPRPAPADLVLVLTGGALTGVDAGDAAAVVARTAAQLDRSGAGAVLAGRAGSADATGAVGVARADPAITAGLSTVDDLQSASGRVSAVLALAEQVAGRAGRYGTAVTAADGTAPAV